MVTIWLLVAFYTMADGSVRGALINAPPTEQACLAELSEFERVKATAVAAALRQARGIARVEFACEPVG